MSLSDRLLKIVGPITPLSPIVRVVGGGYETIQLFTEAGAAVSAPVAGDGIDARIAPTPGALKPGMRIVARCTNGSQPSGPPSPVEIVRPGPSKDELTSLTFVEVPTVCLDWVLLAGTYPGALVQVTHRGVVIGSAVATATVTSVPVSFSNTPVVGDVLEAWQECDPGAGQHIQSDGAVSPPMERRQPYSTISITPPHDCDRQLKLGGVPRGSSLEIDHDGEVLRGYPYVGENPRPWLLKPARAGQTISARVSSALCGRELAGEVTTTVQPAEPVSAQPLGPVCPGAPSVMVSHCVAGAFLSLRVQKNAPNGGLAIGTDTIGGVTAWSDGNCEIPLPAGWADDRPELGDGPGDLSIWVHQQGCSWTAPETAVAVRPLPGAVDSPRVLDAPACSMVINAGGLTPGAYVTPVSDRATFPELGPIQRVMAPQQAVKLYRRLHAGEHVWLVQSGCNVDRESAHVEVVASPAAPVKIVGPVRAPHRSALFADLVVGGRLHVFVNNISAASLEITSREMRVSLPMLRAREQTVSAMQEVCGKFSVPTSEVVRLGELGLRHTPDPLYRGTTQSVIVQAVDREIDTPVSGSVYIAGAKVGVTGSPFILAVPSSGSPPSALVVAAEYEDATLVWHVKDAPKQPPADVHLTVTSDLKNIQIVGVTWEISQINPNGSKQVVASLDGSDVRWIPPSNGLYHLGAVIVVDTDQGPDQAEFRGSDPDGGHRFNWSGTTLSMGWKMMWATGGDIDMPTRWPVAFLATT